MTNPSPLSQRLIQAADVLEEFNRSLPEIYPPDYSWSPSELRREAGHLAEEEREQAELIVELAKDVATARGFSCEWRLINACDRIECKGIATRLVEFGWRKGEPNECEREQAEGKLT